MNKKIARFVLSAAVLSSVCFAKGRSPASSTEEFVASSVILNEIMSKNLLGSNKYDGLFQAALERAAGTSISGLESCDVASGTFSCGLSVTSGTSVVNLDVQVHYGVVKGAQVE